MRPLSGLLSAALALPAWLAAGAFLLAAPQAAQAQTLNRAPLWAVVNFANTSGYGGPEIGVEASDGFVVELSKTNKYDVVSRSDTQQAIANNGLVEPLDTIGLQKLAQDTDADAVATGMVKSVAFSDNPRRATVSVVIEVVDKISGELINGAVAEGTSTPRPIPDDDDDALVNQAIENADFDAVRQITTFSLPRATVLIHEDPETVTLNKGTQDGIFNGLNMLVTRNGTEVGRVQISDASADESYARVIQQGLGIQPQDVATAIYQLPPYYIGPDKRIHVGNSYVVPPSNSDYLPHNASRSLFTGGGGLLVALGAAVGLVALAINGHGGTSSGGNAIGGGRVGGISAALDQVNTSPLNFIDPLSNASTTGSQFVSLRIALNFDPGQLGGNPGTIEYHIYRSPQPEILNAGLFSPISAVGIQIGRLPIISPATPSGEYDSADAIAPLTVQKPASTSDETLDIDTINGGTGTTATPLVGTGLNVGDRVSYSVEGLYSVPNLATGTSPAGTTVSIGTPIIGTSTTSTTTTSTTNTGTNTGLIYSLSELSTSNYVTYLQPVILRAINANTTTYPFPPASVNSVTPTENSYYASSSPSNVIVTVDEVYGGSATTLDYALEFSTDTGFGSNIARFTASVPNSGDSVNFRGAGGGTAFSFGTVNLRSVSQFQSATAIYVRVGVRDLRNGSDENSNPYLWSTADPSEGAGGTLPTFLLPSNPTSPQDRAAMALASGVTVLTPKFTFIPHRAPTSGVDSPALQIGPGHAWLTPSQTPHAASGQTAHPTVGNSSGGARPKH